MRQEVSAAEKNVRWCHDAAGSSFSIVSMLLRAVL
jgi:hypothetical protein